MPYGSLAVPGEQVDHLTPLLPHQPLNVQGEGPPPGPVAIHLVEQLNLAFPERPYFYLLDKQLRHET
jgi:hypothetical protein